VLLKQIGGMNNIQYNSHIKDKVFTSAIFQSVVGKRWLRILENLFWENVYFWGYFRY